MDGLTSDFRNEFPTVMVSQPSSLEPSSKTQDAGGDKAADNSAANDGSGKTTSKTLTFTMSAGTDTENGKRLCRQATAWLVVHARRYGIDSLRANGMRWNRTDGVWAGTETGDLTITATLA